MSSISTATVPPNAECRTTLADGRTLTITASRRPRANRADVKCTVPDAPTIADQMQQVVRLARHTETRLDSRDQVILSMDITPSGTERDWELAAVLADRLVRGLYPLPRGRQLRAQGSSDAWHLGRVKGTVQTLSQTGSADHQPISHLGALSGHADLSAAVSTVRSWFPLHSGGIHDTLDWLEVSVFPLQAPAGAEEDSIAAPGLDMTVQQEIRQTLTAARHFDGKALGRWRSVVRFGQPRFQGGSYQLALVMADRLARGREFVARGRIIATGSSSAWHAGRVDTVDGREAKLALIFDQASHGDRILLPSDWAPHLPPGYAAGLRQKGASLACIEKIGMI